MKSKVGIFTFDFFPIMGGQGRHLVEIFKYLPKHNLYVFSPNINSIKQHHTLFSISKKIGKHLMFSILLNFNLNFIIKKFNLDVVHLHCGPGGLILLKKPKAKLICTVHHTYYQQQKFVSGQKWKYILYLLEKITFKHADKLIAVSEDTKNVLISNYSINPNKIVVIPNGVDCEKFKMLDGVNKIDSSLIYVGRLEERKGITFLINSIPLVKEKIPNVKLFIVGKGKLKNHIELYIKNNNLESNVEIFNSLSDSKLVELYNLCKLAVVPSVFEGFGISVLEAIACGLPVIGTSSDGVGSLAKLFSNSKSVDFGNIVELSNCIIDLAQTNISKDNSNQLIVNNSFNWKTISLATENVYENI